MDEQIKERETGLLKVLTKQMVVKCMLLLIAAYLYCVALDPFFFDYPFPVIVLRQIYSVLLALGVLYVALRLRWVGVLLYTISGLIFLGLHFAYDVFGYSVGFELISAVFQTNLHELRGFVSYSALVATVGGGLALVLVYGLSLYALRWRWYSRKEWVLLAGVVCCWTGVYNIPDMTIGKRYGFYRKMADNTLRNDHELFIAGHMGVAVERWCRPYSSLKNIRGGLKEYFKEFKADEAACYNSEDAHPNDDLVFIMVLGESVRADHVPAGGYARNTMPRVGAEPGVCYYTRMYSYAANTYDSVAAVLSGIIRKPEGSQLTSFASILKKHGFVGRLYSENTMNITDSKRFHVLLGQYLESCNQCRMPIADVGKRILNDLQTCKSSRQLILIENGTGHFPFINEDKYDVYYPCNVNWMAPLPENKKEVLTNDYDNCIISVDSFLADIIDGVRHKNAVMLYVSDHGQLLFENNKLMHGDPTNLLLRQPAAFVWFSPEYEKRHPALVSAMRAVKDKPLAHGQVYATVLKLCGIKSEVPLQIGDFVADDIRNHQHNIPAELLVESPN